VTQTKGAIDARLAVEEREKNERIRRKQKRESEASRDMHPSHFAFRLLVTCPLVLFAFTTRVSSDCFPVRG
jgi:hypothetical protein